MRPITLHLHNIMSQLNVLDVRTKLESKFSCIAAGNIKAFMKMQLLTKFKISTNLRTRQFYLGNQNLGVYHASNVKIYLNPFVQLHLRELQVDWIIPNKVYLLDIRRRLPRLHKLKLSLEGLMLRHLIVELKDSYIEDLAVIYWVDNKDDLNKWNVVQLDTIGETNAMRDFVSSMTGFSAEDCKKIENNEELMEGCKRQSSFSDWRELKNLKMEYRSFQLVSIQPSGAQKCRKLTPVQIHYDEKYPTVSKLCIQEEFSQISSLVHLTKIFQGSNIPSSNIVHILNLKTLDLRRCELYAVNHEGGEEKDELQNSMRGIRQQFPEVSVITGWEEDEDEELDD